MVCVILAQFVVALNCFSFRTLHRHFLLAMVTLVLACEATKIKRFDMFALTDFQQASHRLVELTGTPLARKYSIPDDEFGSSVASLGDFDGDGNPEFAVGALNHGCGAVHILRVGSDADAKLLSKNVLLPHLHDERCECSLSLVGYTWVGSQVQHRRVVLGVGVPRYSKTGIVLITNIDRQGILVGQPRFLRAPNEKENSLFGASLAYVGDMDGDGNSDLLIGAPGESSVYLALLDRTGGAHSFYRTRNFPHQEDHFGISMGALGDIDNDNQLEVLVASKTDIYLMHFGEDGMAIQTSRLKLPHTIRKDLNMRISLSFIGLDDDEDVVFAIGNRYANDGGKEIGMVWIVFMHPDGRLKGYEKLSASAGTFKAKLDEREHFGASLTAVLDSNRDGYAELLIGAPRPHIKWQKYRYAGNEDGLTMKRRGRLWLVDIPGTRTRKVKRLNLADDDDDCIYGAKSCTCAYRSGRTSTCLSLAKVDDNGMHCHERPCADSFLCGMLLIYIAFVSTWLLETDFAGGHYCFTCCCHE